MRTGSMRVAEISLAAIRHNVARVREVTRNGNVIAVIKANGYGHGAEIAARAAIEGGAAMLGVADLEEALALREAGIAAPLLCWLHGAHANFEMAIRHRIEIGVSRLEQLEAMAAAAHQLGRSSVSSDALLLPAPIQLKIDTGLSRNGASTAEWSELCSRAARLERDGMLRVRGIFSHLANAGVDEDHAQAERFNQAVTQLRASGRDPELIHLAASAATFTSPQLHYNTVRVGMAIYGLSPLAQKTSADLGLIPAMTLRSEVVALRQVAAGTGVSYGYNHIVPQDTTLALVPVGYADGMPRALNGAGATVWVAGEQRPIVGRIGMDQCIVDLGAPGDFSDSVQIGDPVMLFGDPGRGLPPVDVWAEALNTINYEVVAGIGPRVRRIPVDDQSHGASRTLQIADAEAMHRLGVRLGNMLRAGDLVVLTGALGAGKTTLSRGIGEGLGVRGPVTSPTFVLARTHPSQVGGAPLVHLDAYRLNNAAELDDLDLDFDGSVVVAEWGSGVLPERDSRLEIVIERTTGGQPALSEAAVAADTDEEPVEPRQVTITGHGPRWRGVAW